VQVNGIRKAALWLFWSFVLVATTISGVRNNPGAIGSSNPRSLAHSPTSVRANNRDDVDCRGDYTRARLLFEFEWERDRVEP
jgi:hypothetical protein